MVSWDMVCKPTKSGVLGDLRFTKYEYEAVKKIGCQNYESTGRSYQSSFGGQF